MANQWLRLYAEFANDPKIQMMSESNQRRYIMLLCIRCNGDVTLQDEEVAFQLRISNEEWATTKALFVSKSLITDDNKPAAWDKRQFASDSSAARVSKHRAKKKAECNVTVTPQIQNRTDTDTEQKEQKTIRAPRFDAQAHLVSLGVDEQIASDWITLRRAKKAPPTLRAIAGISNEAIRAGRPLPDVLEVCCNRGWTGFKAEWITKDQPTPARPINGRQAAISNYAAQAAEARAKNVPIIIERDITGEAVRVA